MYEFNYHRASSAADAAGKAGSCDDAVFMAGGQTLIPTLKQRLASPSDVIDLSGCNDLSGVKSDGSTMTIGAMTTHATVAASSGIDAITSLASNIGDQAVRNRGTIGGSIANNDPAADYPAACLALGAIIITDRREISSDDFFTGLFDTALDEGEVITAIRFPMPISAAYIKFPNPASRYAMVGVFVAKTTDGVRVAVTGAGDNGVFRASDIETALNANFSSSAVDSSSIDVDSLLSDIHAGAEYRRHLIGVMAARAVDAC